MARLTRKETQEQTRARLVETAKDLFLDSGYNATSLGQVAEAAGYSKGAVYSNFATKHELGLAVLEAVQHERIAAVATLLVGADTFEDRLAAFGRWAETNIGDVGWTALEVEFATSTRHIEEVRVALAQRRRTITTMLTELLRGQAETFGITLPAPAEDVATRLLALGIGLGVQRAFDPELQVTVLLDALADLAANNTAPRAR
ncbi:TetR/AcrR family transcriptional regulator [Sciscionella sediminilitoris]|uniref:TetR/AcrR family transcriptional regulator n=1 Tax=Sciscionella sediminilitoris TaxID=1445613 RepID=UPI0004DF7511|nr:TetR/AcrR family transcriptional regulator [Sciscionella sp. SE31]